MENEVKTLTKAIEIYYHLKEFENELFNNTLETETAEDLNNSLLEKISDLQGAISFYLLFTKNDFLDDFLTDVQGVLGHLEDDKEFKHRVPSQLVADFLLMSECDRDQIFKKYYKGA